jgi:radical SAM protein with 4Fe4S-binding SPASM domain
MYMFAHSSSRALRQIEQTVLSTPHYWKELQKLRSLRDLYSWIYFKFPFVFPLARFPLYISVETTNQCNLACGHCWRSIMQRKVGMMRIGLFEKIVGEVSRKKSITLKIAGSGEIALHPGCAEMFAMLSGKDIRVFAYTNGLLFQRFSPEDLLQYNLNTIVVSVDGLDCASYERLRPGGKYQVLREGVTQFRQWRDRIGQNLPEIEIRHVIMPGETSKQLQEFRKDWLRLADTVKFNDLTSLTPDKVNGRATPCRHIRREFNVEWDGKVRFCMNYPTYQGDLNNSTIEEIWHSQPFEFVRERQREHRFEQIPACKRCTPVGNPVPRFDTPNVDIRQRHP